MKKFRCINKKEENYPGFIIEADFPDKIMVCFPLTDIEKGKKLEEEFWLLIPEKDKNKNNHGKKIK